MTLGFRVIETTTSPLWDTGWFDLTRFRVEGSPADPSHARTVLGHFLRDPISQRSFCDPGPWSSPVGHHGPFVHAKLSADWFRPVVLGDLTERVQALLGDPRFAPAPSGAQRRPVDAWIESSNERAHSLFALEAPGDADVRVEFHWIWWAFGEFVSVSPELDELTVAVIGYD